MTQLFPIAAITDEFSQDIEAAVRSMAEIGMGGAELRMVFGKNVIDLTDAELHHAREIVGRHGLEIVSIASPLLKCVLPDAPAGARQHRQNASMFRGGEGAIPFSGRGRIYVEFGYLDDTTLSYRGYHRRVLARYRGCGALDGGDRHGRRRVAHGFRKERYRPDGCRVAPRAGNRGAARPRNRVRRIGCAGGRPAGCARGGAPTSTKGVDVSRGRGGDAARRRFLFRGAAGSMYSSGIWMTELFPIAAITFEFSQDIEAAVRSMAEIGMGGAELRMVFGKNVIDLTDAELDHAREIVGRHGLEIVSIASPLLKCVLPDAPAVARQHRQKASMFRGGEGATRRHGDSFFGARQDLCRVRVFG